MTRIVTLLPSATEIVCALGMREALVGVSHECDWPAEVAGLPAVTSTSVAPSNDSATIDRDVRRILRDALAVYDVDTALLEQLAPDVIVTQDLCDVCAVSFEDVCRAAREVLHPDVEIVNLHPTTLEQIWGDIRTVATALGRPTEGDALLAEMDRRVDDVRRRARELPRANVLAIEWLDPVMIGGMWSPEMIEIAGGTALAAEHGAHAPTLDTEQLRALTPRPDVILIKPCGFDIERTLVEEARVRDLLGDLDGPAVRDGRVWVADGNALFNRPGPRIVDSLETLAACMHPDTFADLAARHRGYYRPISLDPRS